VGYKTLAEELGLHDPKDKIPSPRHAYVNTEERRARQKIHDANYQYKAKHAQQVLEYDLANKPPEVTAPVVSGNYDRLQIVEACRNDLNFLAAMAIPDTYEFVFPPTHITAWSILVDGEADSTHRFLQFALGIPRGHAKTTLIKLFILRCILFTNRSFFLVAASTQVHSINILSDVSSMLSEQNIRAVFGDWRIGLETDTKELKKFGFQGRNITLFAVGAEGAVRGTNVNNERPDVIIMDDIQTKECADSVLQSKTLMEWMVGTLMKSKSPRRCLFIFAGNMFAARGSILRHIKNNPTWVKFISGAILADGTALWPELRSLDSLLEELDNDIAMGQAHIFFSEVLNDTDTGINNTVDYSKFPTWPWTVNDLPQGKFILIDPSQGKGKDADVILSAEVYDSKIGIRAIHEEHYSPINLIRKALIIAIKSETYCIAIESMAYQATLLFWFEHICQEVGISGIAFVPIYTTNMSKNSRISGGIKAMQTHEIYLHPDVRSMVQRQIADWNPMKRDNKDDILDAISNAQKVLAEYTYDIMVKSNLFVMEASASQVREDNHAF
jgi:hypothetical protein